MKLAEISIKRNVGTILFTLSVVFLGIISIPRIPVSFWPEFVAPTLIVMAPYPGAGPEEIEEQLAKPLEEEFSTIDGVEEIETTCMEGLCQVYVRFGWGIDFEESKVKVQERTNKARSRFPRGVLEPKVLQVQDFLPPGIELGFRSDTRDLNEIKDFVETNLKNRFLRLKDVATVQIFGGFDQEVAVEVDAGKLAAYGLSLSQISGILASENMDLPAGKLKTGRKNYFVRTTGKFKEIDDIENLIIAAPNGKPIRLKNVAKVHLKNKERQTIIRLNGEPMVGLAVREKSGGNTVTMCDEVKDELKKIRKVLPKDIQMTIIQDQSVFIKNSIQNVVRNAAIGAILASIILLLFLGNLRNTLIIVLSIPISIIGTFFLIDTFGLTINTISLGGLALGVGMIVDSSVVVIENIYRHLRENNSQDRLKTVVDATSEVGIAITASTLTSVVVFFPLAFLMGLFAVLLGELALTIVFALSLSIIVALTIVPMLSYRLMKPEISQSKLGFFLRGWQALFERMLSIYRKTISWSLRHKLLTIFMAILIFIVSIMVLMPLLDVELMPKINQGEFRVELVLPEGSTIEKTDLWIKRIEHDLAGKKEIEQLYTTIGVASARGELKPNYGMINIKLKKEFYSQIASLMDEIRRQWTEIPGTQVRVRQIEVTEGMKREPVNVRIVGDNLQVLEEIGQRAMEKIQPIPGIVNLKSSIQEGFSEFNINVDRVRAADLGLSTTQIAGNVSTALLGAAITKLSSYGKEYDIRVKLNEKQAQSINDILNLPLATPKGVTVPLSAVATVSLERAPSQIKRFDQQRVVEIKADVLGRSQRKVAADVKQKVLQLHLPRDYYITFGGQSKAIRDSFSSLMTALLIAIFLVYVVMGTQFNSFKHPFTIAMTIPLAMIGVLLGLVIFGAALSMNALLGSIMLVGIVVNNGILLIDYITQLRARGYSKNDAIVEAGTVRMRPILITALTTIFAMLPIAVGLGEGGEALQPLGAVVVGGLTTSTFLTLIVVPVVYSAFEGKEKK
ncbi:MAG: efflux RND transporter permease subunit [Calditrichaeota bacterium]|nr:efflux RND transporter permease subunit [Calditrichota bacterium]